MLFKALLLVVLFAAVASRGSYKLTSRVFGGWVANAGGCATESGALLHGVVFVALAAAVMRLAFRRHRQLIGKKMAAMGPRAMGPRRVVMGPKYKKMAMGFDERFAPSGSQWIGKKMGHALTATDEVKRSKNARYTRQRFYDDTTKRLVWRTAGQIRSA